MLLWSELRHALASVAGGRGISAAPGARLCVVSRGAYARPATSAAAGGAGGAAAAREAELLVQSEEDLAAEVHYQDRTRDPESLIKRPRFIKESGPESGTREQVLRTHLILTQLDLAPVAGGDGRCARPPIVTVLEYIDYTRKIRWRWPVHAMRAETRARDARDASEVKMRLK